MKFIDDSELVEQEQDEVNRILNDSKPPAVEFPFAETSRGRATQDAACSPTGLPGPDQPGASGGPAPPPPVPTAPSQPSSSAAHHPPQRPSPPHQPRHSPHSQQASYHPPAGYHPQPFHAQPPHSTSRKPNGRGPSYGKPNKHSPPSSLASSGHFYAGMGGPAEGRMGGTAAHSGHPTPLIALSPFSMPPPTFSQQPAPQQMVFHPLPFLLGAGQMALRPGVLPPGFPGNLSQPPPQMHQGPMSPSFLVPSVYQQPPRQAFRGGGHEGLAAFPPPLQPHQLPPPHFPQAMANGAPVLPSPLTSPHQNFMDAQAQAQHFALDSYVQAQHQKHLHHHSRPNHNFHPHAPPFHHGGPHSPVANGHQLSVSPAFQPQAKPQLAHSLHSASSASAASAHPAQSPSSLPPHSAPASHFASPHSSSQSPPRGKEPKALEPVQPKAQPIQGATQPPAEKEAQEETTPEAVKADHEMPIQADAQGAPEAPAPVENGVAEDLEEEEEAPVRKAADLPVAVAKPSAASPPSPIIIVGGDEAAYPLPSDKGFQFSFGTVDDVPPAQEPKEASEEPRSPAEEPEDKASDASEAEAKPPHDAPVCNGHVEDASSAEDEPKVAGDTQDPRPASPPGHSSATETPAEAPEPVLAAAPVGKKTWASLLQNNKYEPVVVRSSVESEPGRRSSVAAEPESPRKAAASAASASAKTPEKGDPVVALLRRELVNLSLEQGSGGPEVRGLANRGNWCYINAVLQALLACPPFFHLLRKLGEVVPSPRAQPSTTPTLDALVGLVREVRAESGRGKGKPSPIEPVGMQELVGRLCPEDSGSFKHGRQEDAQEFLICLLNAAHEELLAVEGEAGEAGEAGPAQAPNEDDEWQEVGPGRRAAVTRHHAFRHSHLSRIFAGQLRYHISEAGGGKDAVNLEPFFTLSLEISGDGVSSLETALTEHFRKETFRRSVSGTGGAKAEVDATKTTFLGELPQVLAVHLKYFQYSEEAGSAKVFKRIPFQLELAVPSKLMPPKAKMGVRSYKLFAVVFHHGEALAGGHYTADVWTGGRWVEVDDARVEHVALSHLHQGPPQRVPYLLFYRRSDLIPPPPAANGPALRGAKAKAAPSSAKPHAALPSPSPPKGPAKKAVPAASAQTKSSHRPRPS